MGSTVSLQHETSHLGLRDFHSSEWNKVLSLLKRTPSVQILHQHHNQESLNIYESLFNKVYIEEYLVKHQSKQSARQYLQHLLWRNKCQQLVHALYMSNNQTNKEFCREDQKIELYLEHIPLRLDRLNDIPFPQNLTVLKQSLLGFKYIFSRYKNLSIRQQHICISYDYKVKVWMNQDLSSPKPQYQQLQQIKSQSKIVQKIINLIHQNTDHSTEIFTIRQFLIGKSKKINFKSAIEGIYKFASKHKIKIPEIITSTKVLFEGNNSIHTFKPINSLVNLLQTINSLEQSHIFHSPIISKLSESQSTDVATPQKYSQTERLNLECNNLTNLSPTFLEMPFRKKAQGNTSFSYVKRRQFSDKEGDVVALEMSYAKNPLKPCKRWSYWSGSKQQSQIDAEIAADLQKLIKSQ